MYSDKTDADGRHPLSQREYSALRTFFGFISALEACKKELEPRLRDIQDGWEELAKLDSMADVVFLSVCLIRLLPVLALPVWLWGWVGLIALMRLLNILSGFVCRKKLVLLHTRANKLTGALLFLLPLSLGFLNIAYTAVPLCALASFAAIQEGHFIRTGREIS